MEATTNAPADGHRPLPPETVRLMEALASRVRAVNYGTYYGLRAAVEALGGPLAAGYLRVFELIRDGHHFRHRMAFLAAGEEGAAFLRRATEAADSAIPTHRIGPPAMPPRPGDSWPGAGAAAGT